MAPTSSNQNGVKRDEDEYYDIKGDRKTRKPLVEKKRRARINESLQELRVLVADYDLQSKMENAEVLEMTVKRVESILQNHAQEVDTMNREACERFAAGYIQCMHEVHTFVSNCPEIDTTIAADLLNHLLECMSLNDDGHLQMMLSDIATDGSSDSSTWLVSDSACAALVSPRIRSVSSGWSPALSPAPSTSSSSDDVCSDMDETDSEQSHISDGFENQDAATVAYSNKSIWRPW